MALVLGFTIAWSATAQIPDLFARHRGNGSYEIRGTADRWKLTEASVQVRSSEISIRLIGNKLDLRMNGRATELLGRKQIQFDLATFDGEPTNAKGWVRLDSRGGFERLEIDGNSPARLGISFFASGLNMESGLPDRPTPPIVDPPTSGYRMTEEHGTDRRGYDLTDFRARDLADCQAACLNDHRCQAYSFSRPESQCWLKSGTPSASSNRDFVSGEKTGTQGSGSGAFLVRDGFDQLGSDIASFQSRDARVCEDRCEQNPRCVAFTQDQRTGMCYLKDRRNTFRPAPNKVTGARQN